RLSILKTNIEPRMHMGSGQIRERVKATAIEISKRREALRKSFQTREMKAAGHHLIDRNVACLFFTETLLMRNIAPHEQPPLAARLNDTAQQCFRFPGTLGFPS